MIDTQLRSGRHIRIRSVTPGDGQIMREGMSKMSPQSRYFRFFSGAQELPDNVIERLLSVDGSSHIAWGALDCDDPEAPAIAVVHGIRAAPSTMMEFSAVVLDAYQSEGISKLLSAVLFTHCLTLGETLLVAHVLEENHRAKTYIGHLGGKRLAVEGVAAEYRIDIAEALASLLEQEIEGADEVFAALDPYLPDQSAGNA
ncbi:MAG: GNAT family N-acetyltransferase [Erythrobacter sp.]